MVRVPFHKKHFNLYTHFHDLLYFLSLFSVGAKG